ncbi:DUF4843 domain-containing protein [Pararcticibacter amylolyticus]|nr:DUF4843 domain-containing protein [Pararcticibacter amylolyticus]
MKTLKIFFSGLMLAAAMLQGCKKDDIDPFSGVPAINFQQLDDSKRVISSLQYSFMTNPSNDYIQEVTVKIMGDTVNYDRHFNVEVVKDPETTAPDNLYQVIGGIVKAGEFTGKLSVKLLNSAALSSSNVALKLRIVDSEDFRAGNLEYREFTIRWTNQIVVPNPWSYFQYFFTTRGSTAAYRIILQTTGLTKFTVTEFRAVGNDGAIALGTKFGDYVMQWNKDHPGNRLKHDDGTLAGQDIVPLYYTHSKYD